MSTPPAVERPAEPPPTLARALTFTLVGLLLEGGLLALALGGIGALLAHVPALVLLAVWTAGNFALALLRPVGRQDVVESRADAPLVMLLLFVVPLFATPVSALGERLQLLVRLWQVMPTALVAAVTWGGVAISALGLAIRITAMTRLGARFSPRIALQRTHALETGGLYAYVRHPGYLGSMLATLGGIFVFHSMLAWPLFAIMWIAETLRARREEALLEARFGDAYRAWAMRTGRFLPKPGGGGG